jgi:hypothetical protein
MTDTTTPDPSFAAIAAHKAANLDWAAKLKHNDADHPDCTAANERESVAYEAFWRTMPTTVAGMAAYFQYLQEPRWPVDPDIEPDLEMPFTIIEYLVSEDGPDDIVEWARNMELALRRIAAE